MIGRDQRWKTVALALIGAKIVYFAGISAAVWLSPDFEAGRSDDVYRIWFPEGWPRAAHGEFGRHFATWDAGHYLYLSEAGYVKGARSCAFFPLWPMVIMGGSTSSGWPSRRSRWRCFSLD